MKTLYSRLEKVEKETVDFKFNYLDRFAKVLEALTVIREDIAELKGFLGNNKSDKN